MGIVIRQSIRNTLISYVGVAIGYFNVVWLFPYMLSPEQIGLLRVIQDTAYLLVPFVGLGMVHTIGKFYPVFKTHPYGVRELLTFLIISSLGSYVLFFLLFFIFKAYWIYLFAAKAAAVISYIDVIAVLTFILLFSTLFENYARSLHRLSFATFGREIILRLLTAVVVLLYGFQILHDRQLPTFFLISYFIVFFLLVMYLLFIKHIQLASRFVFLDRVKLKQIMSYGFTFLLAGGSSFIILRIDSLMVASFIGLEQNAIYTTALYIATMVEIPRRALSQVSVPLLATAFHNNDLRQVDTLYKKSCLNQLIIGMFIFLLIAVNVDSLYELMPNKNVFSLGKGVVLLIGFSKLLDMATGINGEIIALSKYYRFNVLSMAVLAVVTVATNIVFIPWWGLEGAAFSGLISVAVYNFLRYMYILRKLKMQPFSIHMLVVFLLGLLFFIAFYFIPFHQSIWIAIGSRVLIISVLYIWIIVYFNLSEDITLLYKKLRHRFLK